MSDLWDGPLIYLQVAKHPKATRSLPKIRLWPNAAILPPFWRLSRLLGVGSKSNLPNSCRGISVFPAPRPP